MAERRATDLDDKETTLDKCDPNCDAGAAAGPVREGGGATGAGNLSPGAASRTGGATTGVSNADADAARARNIPPDP
jgi:hypothetical protein